MSRMIAFIRAKFLLILLFALVSFSCTSGRPEVIEWQFYAPVLLEEAKSEGKPVILNFHADWCDPCHELDRFTFGNPRVIEATSGFIMAKVDLTKYESKQSQLLREEFKITGVPEILFLDRMGHEIKESRVIGYLGPDDFLQLLRTVSVAL